MISCSLFVVGYVSGVTYLENRLYIIYRLSKTIHVFTTDMSNEVLAIIVDGMRFPLDIVACPDERQLYVADSGSNPEEQCVWKVSTANPSKEHVKRLAVATSDVQSLSVRSPNLLVTSHDSLNQYSTTDGELHRNVVLPSYTSGTQLHRNVVLPNYVNTLYHGIETLRGTFVVGLRGTEKSEKHPAVSQPLIMPRP